MKRHENQGRSQNCKFGVAKEPQKFFYLMYADNGITKSYQNQA